MKIEQVTTRTGGYAHLAVDDAPRTLCGAQVHERGFGYVVLSSYKLSFLPTVCARCRTACTALHAKDVLVFVVRPHGHGKHAQPWNARLLMLGRTG